MNSEISRREMLSSLVKAGVGIALIPTVLVTTGCGPALILRAGVPRLASVLWGAVRTRPALGVANSSLTVGRSASAFRMRRPNLTAKALIEASEWYLVPDISASDVRRIEEEQPRLIIEDNRGAQFETPYGIYEDVGVIQQCYDGEPRYLFEEPDFDSQSIRQLYVKEEVGVFSLEHKFGWYQVQTTSRDIGWIHGNCLEELPPAQYYY